LNFIITFRFPIFNFFVVFFLPWTLLGIESLLYNNGTIGEGLFETIGIILNILFFFLSPFWTFTMSFVLITRNGSCGGGDLYQISCDWYLYVKI
jgi:hypothetical protein